MKGQRVVVTRAWLLELSGLVADAARKVEGTPTPLFLEVARRLSERAGVRRDGLAPTTTQKGGR